MQNVKSPRALFERQLTYYFSGCGALLWLLRQIDISKQQDKYDKETISITYAVEERKLGTLHNLQHINSLALNEYRKEMRTSREPPVLWGSCYKDQTLFLSGRDRCGSAAVFYPAVRGCVVRVVATMATGVGKQAPKIVSKSSAGGAGAAGAAGGPPIIPLASPLMGKKKKPFLGMPAPLGYVPGLGRG